MLAAEADETGTAETKADAAVETSVAAAVETSVAAPAETNAAPAAEADAAATAGATGETRPPGRASNDPRQRPASEAPVEEAAPITRRVDTPPPAADTASDSAEDAPAPRQTVADAPSSSAAGEAVEGDSALQPSPRRTDVGPGRASNDPREARRRAAAAESEGSD